MSLNITNISEFTLSDCDIDDLSHMRSLPAEIEALNVKKKALKVELLEIERILDLLKRNEDSAVFTASAECHASQGSAPPSTTNNVCACCGLETTCYKNKKLGVCLDDRCRAQVKSYGNGYNVSERLTEWCTLLLKIIEESASNPIRKAEAEKMLHHCQSRLLQEQEAEIKVAKRRKLRDGSHPQQAAIRTLNDTFELSPDLYASQPMDDATPERRVTEIQLPACCRPQARFG